MPQRIVRHNIWRRPLTFKRYSEQVDPSASHFVLGAELWGLELLQSADSLDEYVKWSIFRCGLAPL